MLKRRKVSMFDFINRDHIMGFVAGIAVIVIASFATGCNSECGEVPVDTDVVETDTDTDTDTDVDTDIED